MTGRVGIITVRPARFSPSIRYSAKQSGLAGELARQLSLNKRKQMS